MREKMYIAVWRSGFLIWLITRRPQFESGYRKTTMDEPSRGVVDFDRMHPNVVIDIYYN